MIATNMSTCRLARRSARLLEPIEPVSLACTALREGYFAVKATLTNSAARRDLCRVSSFVSTLLQRLRA